MLSSKKPGFTLIELIIVTAVIGILAAISLVTYNGFQLRARNAQMADAVKVYKEALTLHRSINGKYPTGNYPNATCLGSSYPSDKCWFNNIDENASFMSALKTVQGGDLPMPSVNKQLLTGAHFAPLAPSLPNTLDGVPTNFLVYTIEGNIPCPVGPVASDGGDGNVLTYSSAAPASGQTSPDTGNNPATCLIALPAER